MVVNLAQQLNAKVQEAIRLQESGDYAAALGLLLSAKAILSSLPSRQTKDGIELEYDANAIDSLIATVRQLDAAQAGFQTTKIEWANPRSSSGVDS